MKIVVATHNEGKLPEIRRILEDELADAAADVELVSAGSLNLPDPVETGVTFEENALLKARDVARRTGLPALADDSGLIVDVLGAAPGILSARWSGVHGDDKANMDLLLAQLADIPDDKRGARFCCAAALVVPERLDACGADGAGSVTDNVTGNAADVSDGGCFADKGFVPTAVGADDTSVPSGVAGHDDEVLRMRETVRLGEMHGMLTREPRGEHGFGYDPIFVPDDQTAENGPVAVREGAQPRTSAEMSASEKNAISHRHKAFVALAPTVRALLR
ncbi:XTP/dITP diphosphohydrolase [Bifidobacterium bohemicum]|uniref:dITP/XTP pyrophosphatase n=1 Tax=Bifidobacterium bohemicum DSM 22767 TaxID=1437606 RepID=A0A086ZEW1_9BIFI|nr:non-canonical purine NTP pyrophosphatase [Bifidobacterium bohemicum]KFI45061.1 Ham1 family protein [Bifidobacterium bohemicum DSM 22767]SCB92487.1 XTP/dITP diphosphohydrolase [Bifidobacterium bohemicum]